jgi:hypothetical protein
MIYAVRRTMCQLFIPASSHLDDIVVQARVREGAPLSGIAWVVGEGDGHSATVHLNATE